MTKSHSFFNPSFRKAITSAGLSFSIVIAYGLAITNLSLFTQTYPGTAALAVIIAWLGTFLLCVINTHSWKKGFLFSLICFPVGLFFGYGILAPLASFAIEQITPYKGVLIPASVNFAWILFGIISVIEWGTNGIFHKRKILKFLFGSLFLAVVISCIEFSTLNASSSNYLEFWKIVFYAPLIWGVVAFSMTQ